MKGLLMVVMMLGVSAHAQTAPAASEPSGASLLGGSGSGSISSTDALSLFGKVKAGVAYVAADFKKNTRFKIDSTVPLTEYDWKHGEWSAGSAVPFLNEGSYLWTGAELTKSLSDPNRIGKAGFVEGVRLNDATRPAAQFVLEKVFRLDLQKHTMLDFLAKSTSAGVTAGHDFNSPDMKKVVINSFTAFFGLEMAFGPDPSAPAAQSVKARRIYFR